MDYNKVIINGEVKLDLTVDDVVAEDVAIGKKFHDRHGTPIVGTSTKDADTSDADALATEILKDKIAYVKGEKIVGIMPNNEGVEGTIERLDTPYLIPRGFHDGSGTVEVADTEKAKLIPNNIKNGVEVLGVVGTYGGEEIKVQKKSATPTFAVQNVLPDENFDYLSEVEVAPIPVTETPNSAGGLTIIVG